MKIMFFLVITYALEIVEPLPEFVLTKYENYFITLSDFFSGDFLEYYSSSPEITIIKNPAQINHLEVSNYSDCSASVSKASIFTVIQSNNFQYLAFPSTNLSICVYQYDLNSLLFDNEYKFEGVNSTTNCFIYSTSTFYLDYNQILLILIAQEKNQENLNYYSFSFSILSIDTENNSTLPIFSNVWDIQYYNESQENLFLCDSDSEIVPIVYSLYGYTQIFFYNFSNYFSPSLIFIHEIEEQQVLFCELSENYFYYVDNINTIYQLSVDAEINVTAKFYLDPTILFNSFTVYYDLLLMTTPDSFFQLSLDTVSISGPQNFQNLFTKNIQLIYSSFEIISSTQINNNIFFLGTSEKGTFFIIAENSQNFPLLYLEILPFNNSNLLWCVFEEINENYLNLIISNSTQMYIYNIFIQKYSQLQIQWLEPEGPFTEVSYEISVKSQSSNENLSQNISVVYINSEIIQTMLIPKKQEMTFLMNFENINGTTDIWLSDLVDGPGIIFTSISFDYAINDSVQSYDYFFNEPLYEFSFIEIYDEYSNFVIFMNNIIFYNQTSFMFASIQDIVNQKNFNFTHGDFQNFVIGLFPSEEIIFIYSQINSSYFQIEYSNSLNLYDTTIVTTFHSQLNQILISEVFIALVTNNQIQIYELNLLITTINLNSTPKDISFSNEYIYLLYDKEIQVYYGLENYNITGDFDEFLNITVTGNNLILFNKDMLLLVNTSVYSTTKSIRFISQADFLLLTNDLIVVTLTTFGNFSICAYDLNNFVYNSYISCIPFSIQDSIVSQSPLSFEVYESTPSTKFIFIFSDSHLFCFSLQVDSNYVSLLFELKPNAEISTPSIYMDVELLITSSFNSTSIISVNVTLELIINGKILVIGNNKPVNVKTTCGEPGTLSLENAVFGQCANYTNLSKTGTSVSNRISHSNNINCSLEGMQMITSESNGNTIVGAGNSTLKICNFQLKKSFSYDFSWVIFTSLKIVYCENNDVIFLTGAYQLLEKNEYWQYKNKINASMKYTIIVWHANFTDESFEELGTTNIAVQADQIRVVTFNSLNFVYCAFNLIKDVTPNNGFINQLVIGTFNGSVLGFKIFNLPIVSYNQVYVNDLDALYDPLFDLIHLYIADLNYGLRIFSCSEFSCNESFSIPHSDTITGVSIAGNTLIASGNSTNIYYYYLLSFTYLYLFKTINAINSNSYPWPGSLILSDRISANFIAQVIVLYDGNKVLQVIDNSAPNDSCIFQQNISEFRSPYINFFNSNTILLQSESMQSYLLNEIVFNFNLDYDNCESGIFNACVMVKNIYGSEVYINFTYEIDNNYSSNLRSSIWMALIFTVIGGIVFLIIVAILIYKCCFKKKRKNKNTMVLFTYHKKTIQNVRSSIN